MIQLKLKTEYSFGQTFASIKNVIARLKELNCTHAGIVDNSTWGHVAFYKACKEANIHPLLGAEVVVSDDDEFQNKMWFLARNKDGLQELYRALSKASLQAISTRSGKVSRLYRRNVLNFSENIIKFAGEIVDSEFLIECGAYLDLSPASRILNFKKEQLSKNSGLKLVEVSDNAYCKIQDRQTFEFIGPKNIKQSPQHILDSLKYQDAAIEIVSKCELYDLPKAPMVHADGDLEKLCRDGIKFRKMESIWNEEYEQRLQYELELIKSKDFESYFIIVADMVHYAKQHMLVGPSRGCFLPGQKVITTNISGNQVIKNIENINAKIDYVLDACGQKQKVLNKFEYDIHEEIIELEFDDGTILKCTKDHEILTHDGYVKAEELNEGHIICSLDKNNMKLSKLRQNGWPEHLAHKTIDLGFIYPEDVIFVNQRSKQKVKFNCECCGSESMMQIRHFAGRSNGFANSKICQRCYPKILCNCEEWKKKNSESQLILKTE